MLIANIFDQSLFVSCVFKDSKIEHCNIYDDSDVEFVNTKVITKSNNPKKENIVLRVSKEYVYDSPPSILYTDSNVTYCIPEEYFTKINNYNYIIIPENEQFFEIKKKNRNNEVEVLNLNRSNFIQLANKVIFLISFSFNTLFLFSFLNFSKLSIVNCFYSSICSNIISKMAFCQFKTII